MRRLVYFALAIVMMGFGAVSCQESEDITLQSNVDVSRAPLVSVQDAKTRAMDLVSNFMIKTRSGETREVGEVYALRVGDILPATRSTSRDVSPADTLMYIVNFKDDQGFVLVSASNHTESIFAYVEEGSLRPDQQIENPGFSFFMDRLGDYLLGSGDNGPLFPPIDTTGFGNPFTMDSVSMDIAVDFMKEPLLTTNWHEDSPFNDECPLKYNRRSKAGDGAVALAQVAAYYQSPSSMEGHTYYWADILDGEEPTSSAGMSSVAHLVHDIGEFCDAQYGRYHTDIDFSNMEYCLDEMDYNYDRTSYSYNLCKSEIKANRPVIARGYDSSNTTSHIWVMDGAVSWKRYYTIFYSDGSVSNQSRTETLVHCNWGLGGNYNGYFQTGIFDINKKKYEDDVYHPVVQDHYDDTSNFSTSMSIYYHLYPN